MVKAANSSVIMPRRLPKPVTYYREYPANDNLEFKRVAEEYRCSDPCGGMVIESKTGLFFCITCRGIWKPEEVELKGVDCAEG